jgi:hypothetical protein
MSVTSAWPTTVTSAVSLSCLKVQVPVVNNVQQVSAVALGVSAAISIIVGALVATIIAWLFFRKQNNKVCLSFVFLYVNVKKTNCCLLMHIILD